MLRIVALICKLRRALLDLFSSGLGVSANKQINSGDQSPQIIGNNNRIVNHNVVNNIHQQSPDSDYREFQKIRAEADQKMQAEHEKRAHSRVIKPRM